HKELRLIDHYLLYLERINRATNIKELNDLKLTEIMLDPILKIKQSNALKNKEIPRRIREIVDLIYNKVLNETENITILDQFIIGVSGGGELTENIYVLGENKDLLKNKKLEDKEKTYRRKAETFDQQLDNLWGLVNDRDYKEKAFHSFDLISEVYLKEQEKTRLKRVKEKEEKIILEKFYQQENSCPRTRQCQQVRYCGNCGSTSHIASNRESQINLSNAACSICRGVGYNRVTCHKQGSGNNSGDIKNNGVRVKIENNKNEVLWNSYKIIRNIPGEGKTCSRCSSMGHNKRKYAIQNNMAQNLDGIKSSVKKWFAAPHLSIKVCHHCGEMSHNKRSCPHRRRNEHAIPKAQLNEILKGIKKFKDSPKYRIKMKLVLEFMIKN
ncbi:29525_t:CDS:2, partial [Gigaspora margarita]